MIGITPKSTDAIKIQNLKNKRVFVLIIYPLHINMDVLASRKNQRNAENRYRYTDNSRGARSAQMILVSVDFVKVFR